MEAKTLRTEANGFNEKQPHTNGHSDEPSQPKDKQKQSTENNKEKSKDEEEQPPGGFDRTPVPNAQQGYTLRFIFHSAENLPQADLNTLSSDPFVHATLKASGVKRHKEDSDLTHRTKTIHNTTEPDWQDQWIVANVPASGFALKCRLYDEDAPDANDRLGNVTLKVPQVFENWQGIPPPGRVFEAKKRVMSKRAWLVKAMSVMCSSGGHMSPLLRLSVEILGKSDPPHGQMYTVGPTSWVKHFSPLIGRLAGTTVHQDSADDRKASNGKEKENSKSQKYDFQANEMQLAGPIPPDMYHRYVEFRPVIGSMFTAKGLRGKILNKALHKQHSRIYNYDSTTEYKKFECCTQEASDQFLRLAHYDQGSRIFTYVLSLDSVFRFTETGKEFGIDLLSKHTMHSDVATYIAFSGEFFIRRLEKPVASESANPDVRTHPHQDIPGGPPNDDPPTDPSYYQLIIDNDSGTYRPNKDLLPQLKKFMETNFPGLGVVVMDCGNDELQDMKEAQRNAKKKEGPMMQFVMNASQSSLSSNESELDSRVKHYGHDHPSKKEAALNAMENPSQFRKNVKSAVRGESSKQA